MSSINRFQGSEELFLYIKRSMQRFNKLNLPSIAFDLQKEYVRGLINLADLLGKQIPDKLASGLAAFSKEELTAASKEGLTAAS